jgi:hypothetical protein
VLLDSKESLRDAQAVQFHPMPAKKQHYFTGCVAMGLGPWHDRARNRLTRPLRKRSEQYRAKSGIACKGL